MSANYPSARIDEKAMVALWLDIFRRESDDVMDMAIRMCLLSCKHPPAIADIKQAITEWHQKAARNTSALPPARSRQKSPAAEKAFSLVKSGQAQAYMDAYYNRDVWEWIRTKMPDLSDESIRRNYCEVADAYESQSRCLGCQHRDGKCDTSGYYAVPLMDPGGWIRIEMARCAKGRAM